MEQHPHHSNGGEQPSEVNSYGTDDPETQAHIENARIDAARERQRDRIRFEHLMEVGIRPDDAEAAIEFEQYLRQYREANDQLATARSALEDSEPGPDDDPTRKAAIAAWAELIGSSDPDQLERFEDFYVGSYDSAEAWARAMAEDLDWPAQLDREVTDPFLRRYLAIDYTRMAREGAQGWDVVQGSDGRTHVFFR
jgi:hypothetical protein